MKTFEENIEMINETVDAMNAFLDNHEEEKMKLEDSINGTVAKVQELNDRMVEIGVIKKPEELVTLEVANSAKGDTVIIDDEVEPESDDE